MLVGKYPVPHSVAVISDTTHEIIKNITVDDAPRGIAYDSGKNGAVRS